ncbi:HET domain-containing protein [Neurospora intermedia]|uniref:HET domain-containing protein n=1 Tax=Neurospora intermedia TaxID=5142 RepID=A0ABR3D089_NEUIN
MELIVGADIPFIKPGKQRSRVRRFFLDRGRLSTAYRRIVAKMPFPLMRDGSLNLCERCKRIDLDGIFNSPVLFEDFQHSKMVLTLGILDKDSPCALCPFFYSMGRPSVTGKTTDIYCLGRCNLHELIKKLIKSRWLWETITSVVWTVDPESRTLDWEGHGVRSLYQRISTRPQLLMIPQSTKSFLLPEASQETLKGLPVHETSVNYPLLRYWIKRCEGHLDCSYLSTDYTNSRTRPVTRGIDCISRRIVDLQPGGKYIALSYVWGNNPLPENNSSRVLPANAPKVIEDAMVVVKKLGQRYLWVDQYCIDQHDDQDKHAQIKNMDRIYEGSHATIVAFSGVDSSSGLPGVSSTPRIPQLRFTSSKVTLLGFTPFLTRQTLEASVWMKRGWTFQEALVSRRLLIFTQEQVYFLCSRGWSVESCAPTRRMIGENMDDELYKWISQTGFESILHVAKASMNLISPLTRLPVRGSAFEVRLEIRHLVDLVGEFTRRQLSFQSDALDAVRGLLSRVPVLTYWGIPVYKTSENSKDVSDFDPTEANAIFFRCLFWMPDDRGKDAEYLGRREGFPSWSWLGWRLPVTWVIFPHLYFHCAYDCVTVKVEDADGTLLSISDLVELFGAEVERSRMLSERTTYLWLEGLVLTLGFQPFGNRHGGDTCFCCNQALGWSDYPCLMNGSCALSERDSLFVEVSFRLNVKGSEEIWRTTLAKKGSCLWIYFSYYEHHLFLILDERDDAAYCVGTLCLQDDTEDKNLLGKLKAKVPHEYRKVRIG